jgi:alcohol dehydrogenase
VEEEKQIHVDLAQHMQFAAESDSDDTAIEKLLTGIREWTNKLEIPKLRDLPGIRKEDFERIVELAVQNNSTPSNVRTIGFEDYMSILQEAYDDTY